MVSPASHVLLLLLAIVLVREVSAGPSARREVAAGLAIGLVFYTPMYYWTLLIAGVAVLAVASAVRNRLALLRVLVLGALVGAPALYHTRLASQSQMVRETLTRELILYPGRTPHLLEVALFALTTAILVVLWTRRRSAGPACCFLAPFLACGAVFFLQCVVTGLHVQEFHWAHTITPLAYLAPGGVFSERDSKGPECRDVSADRSSFPRRNVCADQWIQAVGGGSPHRCGRVGRAGCHTANAGISPDPAALGRAGLRQRIAR